MPNPESKPLEGVRVLVVEDDPQGAKLLRIVLEQAGAVVRTAWGAADVPRRLASFRARLVLLDLVLPDEHGLAVLRALQPRVERKEMTVIVISSVNGPQTERAITELGCAAYFRKPIETSTLAKNLASYLGE